MNVADPVPSPKVPALANGPGAAAVLSAAIGSFALAVLALAADKSAHIKSILNFYRPTGPLSGVTTTAILVWLLTWGILEWRWGRTTVALGRIALIAFALLVLSFLLTFPSVADLI